MECKKITDFSLARVWEYVQKRDSGTISAYINAREYDGDEPFTESVNKENSLLLKCKLWKAGFGIVDLKSIFIENYDTSEALRVQKKSFLVIDKNQRGNLKETLVKLGTEFEQDCITFQKKGNISCVISTTTCTKSYPGYGKIGVEVKLNKAIFGEDRELYQEIEGRPFVFESLEGYFETYGIVEIKGVNRFKGVCQCYGVRKIAEGSRIS